MRFSLTNSPNMKQMNRLLQLPASYKDLGIIVTESLSWSSHINNICTKAYRSLHVIRRNIPSGSSVNLKSLIKISPRKDIGHVEKVQRHATTSILQNHCSNYKSRLISSRLISSRLISLYLLPVSMWLELQDILFLFKVKILSITSIYFNSFRLSQKIQDLQQEISCGSHKVGRHYYFNRVVRWWNFLDLEKSLFSIRLGLLNFMWEHFMRCFDPDTVCTYHIHCPCSNWHLQPFLSFHFSCTYIGVSLSVTFFYRIPPAIQFVINIVVKPKKKKNTVRKD